MTTQCETKREMLRVMSEPRGSSLSPKARIKNDAKRSSSSPPSMRGDAEQSSLDSTDSLHRCLLIVTPPPGERDTASPQRNVPTPEPSETPPCSSEPWTTEQDTDFSEGVAESKVTQTPLTKTKLKLSSRYRFLLKMSDVSDDPSDSDMEIRVTKKR